MRIQADGFVAWPKGWVWLSALSLVSTLGAEVQGGPPPAGQAPARFSPKVIQQFQAIQMEKATWTPVQRKIGSNLLLETKQRLGQAMAAGMPALRQAIAVDRSGLVLVDIKATVTDALLKRIGDLGGAGGQQLCERRRDPRSRSPGTSPNARGGRCGAITPLLLSTTENRLLHRMETIATSIKECLFTLTDPHFEGGQDPA